MVTTHSLADSLAHGCSTLNHYLDVWTSTFDYVRHIWGDMIFLLSSQCLHGWLFSHPYWVGHRTLLLVHLCQHVLSLSVSFAIKSPSVLNRYAEPLSAPWSSSHVEPTTTVSPEIETLPPNKSLAAPSGTTSDVNNWPLVDNSNIFSLN